MNLTANKGEWGELYAFFKILSDQKLFSADESLTLIPDSFVKVLSLLRYEKEGQLTFRIDELSHAIHVIKSGVILTTVPLIRITPKLASIFQQIKSLKGAFSLPDAEEFMQALHCEKVSATASKKADIVVEIDDPKTGCALNHGFSIKTQIGGLSTLFNASGATNFEYEIVPSQKTENHSKALIGLNSLLTSQQTLKFLDIPNENFRKNLKMIERGMPDILGEMVKSYYLGQETSIQRLTSLITYLDPIDAQSHENFYEHKIQEFLWNIALGMQPSKPWKGTQDAHGGYIIVKENGELACYHVYNGDRFKKFLFINTKLDTPSRSRHKFGQIYEKNGTPHLLLNLQIRFKG
jgi:type II restriction enzyme